MCINVKCVKITKPRDSCKVTKGHVHKDCKYSNLAQQLFPKNDTLIFLDHCTSIKDEKSIKRYDPDLRISTIIHKMQTFHRTAGCFKISLTKMMFYGFYNLTRLLNIKT